MDTFCLCICTHLRIYCPGHIQNNFYLHFNSIQWLESITHIQQQMLSNAVLQTANCTKKMVQPYCKQSSHVSLFLHLSIFLFFSFSISLSLSPYFLSLSLFLLLSAIEYIGLISFSFEYCLCVCALRCQSRRRE